MSSLDRGVNGVGAQTSVLLPADAICHAKGDAEQPAVSDNCQGTGSGTGAVTVNQSPEAPDEVSADHSHSNVADSGNGGNDDQVSSKL